MKARQIGLSWIRKLGTYLPTPVVFSDTGVKRVVRGRGHGRGCGCTYVVVPAPGTKQFNQRYIPYYQRIIMLSLLRRAWL